MCGRGVCVCCERLCMCDDVRFCVNVFEGEKSKSLRECGIVTRLSIRTFERVVTFCDRDYKEDERI